MGRYKRSFQRGLVFLTLAPALPLATFGAADALAEAMPPLTPCPHDTFNGPGIPFFSKEGRVLMRRFHIPSPIRRMTPDAVDPPRSLAADRWRAPFCKEWIDTKVHCAREANKTIKCRPRTPEEQAAISPKQTECIASVDFPELLRTCPVEHIEDTTYLDNGNKSLTPAWSGAQLNFSIPLHRWCFYIMEDALLPLYNSKDRNVKAIRSERTTSCTSRYSYSDEDRIQIFDRTK